jgi:phage terminase large subunit
MPESDELLAALTQTTYTFKGDRFLLEPKEQVKEKLGYSPDDFDAAILTFAEPVTATRTAVRRDPYRAQTEYDPFAAQAQPGRALADYDPYAGR